MDDAVRMGDHERIGQSLDDFHRHFPRQFSTAVQPLAQRLAADQLEHEIGLPVFAGSAQNTSEPRMFQRLQFFDVVWKGAAPHDLTVHTWRQQLNCHRHLAFDMHAAEDFARG